MSERFIDKIKRVWCEWRLSVLKRIIKWAVARYDDLHDGTFLALSWGHDKITDYHVIAERSYDWGHVFGTRVEKYGEEHESNKNKKST